MLVKLLTGGKGYVHGCGRVGRFYMWVAAKGERVLSVGLPKRCKARSLNSLRLTMACNWWDHWRGLCLLPSLHVGPVCPTHGPTQGAAPACPYQ